MNKLIKFSVVLFLIFLCVLLVTIFYPGRLAGIMYDIQGSRLRRMAERGNPAAQYNLAEHYANPPSNISADSRQAVNWYRKAAEQGYCLAQWALACRCKNGLGADRDLNQAVLWFGKASEQGFLPAQRHLAELYNTEPNADNSLKRADWFRQGAEEGSKDCQYQLALCYLRGQGAEKDPQEAARWLLKGADNGSCDCQYQLGCCYAKGEGVSRDIGQAVYWYREAAEQGHEGAQKALQALGKQL